MPEAPLPVSRKTLRWSLAIGLLAVGAAVLWQLQRSGVLRAGLAAVLQWIKDLGPWAPLVFILAYVVSVVVCLPASLLTTGGGFIFGMFYGSIYVLIAANLAANATFLIGRHLARNWVARKFEGNARFKAIDAATAREGWKIVALIRLAPIFPFPISSYGFGLTRVPFWEYAAANIAMIPGTLMYVYLGSIGRDLTQKASTPLWMKVLFGVLIAIVVIYITRFAKRALGQRIS